MSGPLEWEKPGKLHDTLRRLRANRKQLRRGTACFECRRKRTRCDGQRPCKTCVECGSEDKCVGREADARSLESELASGIEAGAQIQGAFASRVPNPAQSNSTPSDWTNLGSSVALSSVSESSVPFVSATAESSVPFVSATAEVSICQNLHEGRKWLRRFTDLGFDHGEACEIVRSLPPKLSAAVSRLDDRVEALAAAQAQRPSPSQPRQGSPAWDEAQRCASVVCKLNSDGTTSAVKFNQVAKTMFCGPMDWVVVQMGVNAGRIPLPSSQYRYLCIRMHISWMFLTGQKVGHIFSLGKLGKQDLCFRLLVRFFSDHTATCNVPLTPAEYNAAIAASREANGVFLECTRSAAEFFAQREEIVNRERIAAMAATESGSAQLERLADTINARLDTLPPLLD